MALDRPQKKFTEKPLKLFFLKSNAGVNLIESTPDVPGNKYALNAGPNNPPETMNVSLADAMP